MSQLAAFACSVCFGDPNSLLAKGAKMGVLGMLGVVTLVLAGIAWTAFVWSRRSQIHGHHD